MTTLVISSILISFLIGWLIGKYMATQEKRAHIALLEDRNSQATQQITQLQFQNVELTSERNAFQERSIRAEQQNELLTESKNQLVALQNRFSIREADYATVREQLKHANERLEMQRKEMEQLHGRFQQEFKILAQSILDEKSKKFSDINEEKMKGILDPLQKEIGEFKKQVQDSYNRESNERFALGREIHKLVETSTRVSQEANNLTTALKGNTKQQGNWGEMILESILENSGLTKDREYFLQEFIRDKSGQIIKDGQGKGLQPDVIVQYPDSRKIIIDSKVSLVAWDRYVNAANHDEQQQALKEHIQSVKAHIDGLSRKNYPKFAEALDYVLMFVPVEPAFLEALKTDRELWKFAYDKQILLVSPTNLLAVLKIVADLWKIEQQNLNAIHIADAAGDLYDKFVGFIKDLDAVGLRIAEAQEAFIESRKKLGTGNGNVIRKVEAIKKMGARAKKQLDDRTLREAMEDE